MEEQKSYKSKMNFDLESDPDFAKLCGLSAENLKERLGSSFLISIQSYAKFAADFLSEEKEADLFRKIESFYKAGDKKAVAPMLVVIRNHNQVMDKDFRGIEKLREFFLRLLTADNASEVILSKKEVYRNTLTRLDTENKFDFSDNGLVGLDLVSVYNSLSQEGLECAIGMIECVTYTGSRILQKVLEEKLKKFTEFCKYSQDRLDELLQKLESN